MTESRKVTIDNVEYALSELSEQARNLVASVQIADQEIGRLRRQLALAQTARATYANALQERLPKRG